MTQVWVVVWNAGYDGSSPRHVLDVLTHEPSEQEMLDYAHRHADELDHGSGTGPFAVERTLSQDYADADDLLMAAWGLLANVCDGDWDGQSDEWQVAVVGWRDRFHAHLDAKREIDR